MQASISAFVNAIRFTIGYPLDTIKVRMQVENYKSLSFMKCYRDLVKYNGVNKKTYQLDERSV